MEQEELSTEATDFCWFSLDKMNNLSASTSAGGFVPNFVESDLRLHVELEKCLGQLAKFENNSIINRDLMEEYGHDIGSNLSTYDMYTEFGLYTYDNQYLFGHPHEIDVYKWFTRPIIKLDIALLPGHLVKRLPVFPDIIFSERGSFEVNADLEMVWRW